MLKKILISIVSILFVQQAYAAKHFIPPFGESLVSYPSVKTNAALDNQFSLLVWNVHKGADDQVWVDDMIRLVPSAEIVLLQEAMDDAQMKNLFSKALDSYEWFFAKSFSYTNSRISSGVASGATTKSTKTIFHRTNDTEPIVGTPKTTMVSFYNMANGQNVAILNIHGLNVTSNEAFYRQIDETLALVKNHQGPIVYAGDFNTNNKPKFLELIKKMEAYGLKRITYAVDERNLKLDWIFIRGCSVIESEILYNFKSSDHTPLRAKLSCN